VWGAATAAWTAPPHLCPPRQSGRRPRPAAPASSSQRQAHSWCLSTLRPIFARSASCQQSPFSTRKKNLTKEDILYLYLNQIYFGQSAYGIEQASQTYFKKSVKDLTLPEMSILAGLPQAPSRYSPVRNPKRAKERQVYVLRRMAEVKFITKQEAEKAIETPVKVFIFCKKQWNTLPENRLKK
jgi:hypothetical protein